jgi:hypothetical protein
MYIKAFFSKLLNHKTNALPPKPIRRAQVYTSPNGKQGAKMNQRKISSIRKQELVEAFNSFDRNSDGTIW